MAGTIIADYIRTDANKLSLNVGNTTFATINATGFYNSSGGQIISQNGQINAASIASGTIPTAALADDSITRAKLGISGAVLQTVHTTYTGTASTNSSTPQDISGFSATITPTSANSKILVFVSVAFGFDQDTYPYVLLKRNGTSIGTGTSASGSRVNVFMGGYATNIASIIYRIHQFSRSHLDSPNTTSALTYQIALSSPYSGYGYINRQGNLLDAVYTQYPASSITLMEIAE